MQVSADCLILFMLPLVSPTGELDFACQNDTYWHTEKHSAELLERFLFPFMKDALAFCFRLLFHYPCHRYRPKFVTRFWNRLQLKLWQSHDH